MHLGGRSLGSQRIRRKEKRGLTRSGHIQTASEKRELTFQNVIPFQLTRACPRLVCSKSLDPLRTFVLAQEAGGSNVVIEFPVDEWRADNGAQADEEKDAAPRSATGNDWKA